MRKKAPKIGPAIPKHYFSITEISRKLGKSRTTIEKQIRKLEIAPEVIVGDKKNNTYVVKGYNCDAFIAIEQELRRNNNVI